MSNLTLAAIGRFLVEYGLLGLLVTMPPALFLTLGLKKINRLTLLFSGGLLISLGSAILGIALEGITTGEVLALSLSTLMVTHTGNPVFFWISTVAFLVISLGVVGLGLFFLSRACLPFNTSVRTESLEADRWPSTLDMNTHQYFDALRASARLAPSSDARDRHIREIDELERSSMDVDAKIAALKKEYEALDHPKKFLGLRVGTPLEWMVVIGLPAIVLTVAVVLNLTYTETGALVAMLVLPICAACLIAARRLNARVQARKKD